MIAISSPPISDYGSLCDALQRAIALELFTIPPYLVAYHTLRSSEATKYARALIRDIYLEEMLHVNLACNILNAIGGTPSITSQAPCYPSRLPLPGATEPEVHLVRFSKKLVEDVFLKIEEPEVPLDIPVKGMFTASASGPRTIGQFYGQIRLEIMRQGEAVFEKGDPNKQVQGIFGGDDDIKVSDLRTALLAIDTIVSQGEGTNTSPADLQNEVAHYYRFQELQKGMRIVCDELSPVDYSFDPSEPIEIDEEADVIEMVDDPQLFSFDEWPDIAALADVCDAKYSEMLSLLDEGFNGKPDKATDAVRPVMGELNGAIRRLLQRRLTGGLYDGLYAGPRFIYT